MAGNALKSSKTGRKLKRGNTQLIEFTDSQRIMQVNFNFITMSYDQGEAVDLKMQRLLEGTLNLMKCFSEADLEAKALHEVSNSLIQVHATHDPEYLRANLQVLSAASGTAYVDMGQVLLD